MTYSACKLNEALQGEMMNETFSGLGDMKVIRSNQRFATYSAVNDAGEPVFVKKVTHPDLKDGIAGEVYGMTRMGTLSKAVELPFQVPTLKAVGDGLIVTSWAEGKPMAFSAELSDLDERVRFFAGGFAAIDNATALVHPTATTWTIPGKNGTVVEFVSSNLRALDTTEFFDPRLLERALQLLKDLAPGMRARFTHADFTPGNVMEGEKRTLVDWESSDDLWPRYYDLVNMTFNLSLSNPDLAPALDGLVDQMFHLIGTAPEENIAQLNGIALVRALGSIVDYMTPPNQHHNTSLEMTSEVARRLTRVLEGMLSGQLYSRSMR